MPTTITIPDYVAFQEVSGETVLLNLKTGLYHGLNVVGSRIFQLLSDGSSLEEIAALLTQEYAVDSTTANKDLQNFLDELKERELILVTTDDLGYAQD